jgi:hypothetical protein
MESLVDSRVLLIEKPLEIHILPMKVPINSRVLLREPRVQGMIQVIPVHQPIEIVDDRLAVASVTSVEAPASSSRRSASRTANTIAAILDVLVWQSYHPG